MSQFVPQGNSFSTMPLAVDLLHDYLLRLMATDAELQYPQKRQLANNLAYMIRRRFGNTEQAFYNLDLVVGGGNNQFVMMLLKDGVPFVVGHSVPTREAALEGLRDFVEMRLYEEMRSNNVVH